MIFTLPVKKIYLHLLEPMAQLGSLILETFNIVQYFTRHKNPDLFWNSPGTESNLVIICWHLSKWSKTTLQSWISGNWIILCRKPSVPMLKLRNHKDSVNAIAWAPQSCVHICSVGDDSKAYIWDIAASRNNDQTPLLEYKADEQVTNLSWSILQK